MRGIGPDLSGQANDQAQRPVRETGPGLSGQANDQAQREDEPVLPARFRLRRRLVCGCVSDRLLLVGVIVDVFHVVRVVVGEASVRTGSGLASQRCRFCPTSGDVIRRRSVVVVDEQCYR